jgi:hypothetical protein
MQNISKLIHLKLFSFRRGSTLPSLASAPTSTSCFTFSPPGSTTASSLPTGCTSSTLWGACWGARVRHRKHTSYTESGTKGLTGDGFETKLLVCIYTALTFRRSVLICHCITVAARHVIGPKPYIRRRLVSSNCSATNSISYFSLRSI